MNFSQNISYYQPLIAHKPSAINDDKWNELEQLFESKQYEGYTQTLLEYINADLLKYKTEKGFAIPHGSVQVELEQTEDKLILQAPFLNIENANKVALMRKLCEVKMEPLNLTDVKVNDHEVYFYFEAPLALCNPYKIYAVLRDICLFADQFDDEFIEKFKATNLREPVVTPFEDNLKSMAYQNYLAILDNALERHEAYMAKRHGANAWYVLNIALKQIAFHIHPQGYLRTLIERAADTLSDGNASFYDKLVNGKKAIIKLRNYDQEKFFDCLYKTEVFVPYKYKGKKENIRNNWDAAYQDIHNMMQQNAHEDAAVLMQSLFYNLMFFNELPEDIYETTTTALKDSSNQAWAEAATTLYGGLENIMEDQQAENPFGMDISNLMQEQMKQSMEMMQKMFAQ